MIRKMVAMLLFIASSASSACTPKTASPPTPPRDLAVTIAAPDLAPDGVAVRARLHEEDAQWRALEQADWRRCVAAPTDKATIECLRITPSPATEAGWRAARDYCKARLAVLTIDELNAMSLPKECTPSVPYPDERVDYVFAHNSRFRKAHPGTVEQFKDRGGKEISDFWQAFYHFDAADTAYWPMVQQVIARSCKPGDHGRTDAAEALIVKLGGAAARWHLYGASCDPLWFDLGQISPLNFTVTNHSSAPQRAKLCVRFLAADGKQLAAIDGGEVNLTPGTSTRVASGAYSDDVWEAARELDGTLSAHGCADLHADADNQSAMLGMLVRITK